MYLTAPAEKRVLFYVLQRKGEGDQDRLRQKYTGIPVSDCYMKTGTYGKTGALSLFCQHHITISAGDQAETETAETAGYRNK